MEVQPSGTSDTQEVDSVLERGYDNAVKGTEVEAGRTRKSREAETGIKEGLRMGKIRISRELVLDLTKCKCYCPRSCEEKFAAHSFGKLEWNIVSFFAAVAEHRHFGKL
jgi:hypothetical protein